MYRSLCICHYVQICTYCLETWRLGALILIWTSPSTFVNFFNSRPPLPPSTILQFSTLFFNLDHSPLLRYNQSNTAEAKRNNYSPTSLPPPVHTWLLRYKTEERLLILPPDVTHPQLATVHYNNNFHSQRQLYRPENPSNSIDLLYTWRTSPATIRTIPSIDRVTTSHLLVVDGHHIETAEPIHLPYHYE